MNWVLALVWTGGDSCTSGVVARLPQSREWWSSVRYFAPSVPTPTTSRRYPTRRCKTPLSSHSLVRNTFQLEWTTCISPKGGAEGTFDGLTQLVVSPKVLLQYVCTYVYILGVCDAGWTGRLPLLEHCKWNVSHLLLFTCLFRWITVHEFILISILLQCWRWLHWTVRSKQFYEDGCLQWSTQHWPIASHLAPIYVVCWICKDMKHEGCPWSPHSESVLLMICTSH